jgi:hypothetical protein
MKMKDAVEGKGKDEMKMKRKSFKRPNPTVR